LLKSNKSIVHHQVAVTSNRNLSKKITKRYRIFHRILFRYINYQYKDWSFKMILFEFYDSFKNGDFFLLLSAYLYYLYRIDLIFEQRRVRATKNIKGIKLFEHLGLSDNN
jgi:hypothetical protein